MRVLLSILIEFTLVAASAHGQDRSTHVSIGTLQMTGGGVAQPPGPGNRATTGAAQQRAPTQTHITVGTLQMTGQAHARTQP
jgi:hypothetical protein